MGMRAVLAVVSSNNKKLVVRLESVGQTVEHEVVAVLDSNGVLPLLVCCVVKRGMLFIDHALHKSVK
jgi:hypothetical protein